MEFGVQIFGCLTACKRDTDGFFAAMAGAGFGQIEPCMAFGLAGMPEPGSLMDAVWKPGEWAHYRQALDRHGLTLRSCHVFADDPLACVDEMAEAAARYGISQYVLGVPPHTGNHWKAFADQCTALADALGIALWLHNSHPEIAEKDGGVTVYERILDRCNGALGAQVDVGWAQYGGEEPVAFLGRVKRHLRSVHYKELEADYRTRDADDIRACLGDGCLDVRAIRAFCDPLGITQIVDQDKSRGNIVADQVRSAAVLRGA